MRTAEEMGTLPEELTSKVQFVLWRQERRDGDWTKVPYDPKTHRRASSTDRATWGTYEQACGAIRQRRGYNGLGFVFSDDGEYTGIDLDHCLNNGSPEPWAQAIVAKMNSYTELSPSGNGLHIIVKGKLPKGLGNRTGQIEIYSRSRYFTMTGKHFPGTPRTIEHRQSELVGLHTEIFGKPEEHTPQPTSDVGFCGSDTELLEAARNADNGQKFSALYDGGDIPAYGNDDSAADQALVNMLAFWAGPDHDRIDRLFTASALCRQKWIDRADYRQLTINKALNGRTDFYHKESESTERSPVKAAKQNRPWLLTDLGNARRLVHYYGNRTHYCSKWGKWLVWTGIRWSVDESRKIFQCAYRTTEKLWDECRASRDEDLQPAIAKWHRASQNRARIDGMIHLARSLPGIPISPEELDADPMLLNTQNVTINLRAGGRPQRHNPDDLITKMAPVKYDAEAKSPLWLNCLDLWMNGDQDKIDYLQRLGGVCLTGITIDRVFPIFFGSGKNGKSAFCNTILGLMGDYATTATKTLLAQSILSDEHPTEIADLYGRRLVIAQETKPHMKLRLDLVKAMTGDTKLKGRFMRQDFFEFEVTHKTILMTNNLPVIKETSDAIWDRVHLVEWPVRISDDQQDVNLLDKLKTEWPGILNWLIEGCIKWQEDGQLLPTETIRERTLEYREESDPLADFVNERCILGASNLVTSMKELGAAYDQWVTDNEIKYPSSRRTLAAYFRERGKKTKNVRYCGKQTKCWIGVGLKSVVEGSMA
jgi:putative DNA primase/helicase